MLAPPGLVSGLYLLDSRTRSLGRGTERLGWSHSLYEVLHLLARLAKITVSVAVLFRAGWRDTARGVHSLDTLARTLRRLDAASRVALGLTLVAKLFGNAWRLRRLLIEGLAVPDAAAQKLGPLRYGYRRIHLLRQERPQVWMVPAQLMGGGVAMLADGSAEAHYLRDKLLSREAVEVFVHVADLLAGVAGERKTRDTRHPPAAVRLACRSTRSSIAPSGRAQHSRAGCNQFTNVTRLILPYGRCWRLNAHGLKLPTAPSSPGLGPPTGGVRASRPRMLGLASPAHPRPSRPTPPGSDSGSCGDGPASSRPPSSCVRLRRHDRATPHPLHRRLSDAGAAVRRAGGGGGPAAVAGDIPGRPDARVRHRRLRHVPRQPQRRRCAQRVRHRLRAGQRSLEVPLLRPGEHDRGLREGRSDVARVSQHHLPGPAGGDAGDCLGGGPWYDAKRVIVAGGRVPVVVRGASNVRVFTGTNADGTAAAGKTCSNWTALEGEGLAGDPGSTWNAASRVACGPTHPAAAPRLYCFAAT